MNIQFFRSTWGMTGTLEQILTHIKNLGFDGVEMGAPPDAARRKEAMALLEDLELKLVAQQWSDGNSPEEHLQSLEEQFINGQEMNPLLINSHTGKDFYALEDNLKLIDAATALSQKYGVPVVHETHRGRATFCSNTCMALLDARPETGIAADLSHWCCVHESLLEDQAEAVERLSRNTRHIHARVGYSQGPQINDPRAPEWEAELNTHLAWWDRMVEMRRADGTELLTITPEFGPYPYMQEEPNSRKPLADLDEVNQHMLMLLKQRYAD